jgi:DNA replication initiation complex subunit (GINS family)
MEELTPEVFFEKLQAEKKTGELLTLPVDFYQAAEKEAKRMELNSTFENKHYLENFKKLLNQLKERRIQKVLIYLAYNKQLPQPIPKEEEDIYNKIKEVISGESKVKPSTKIKINIDIPEIITPKGSKIGPFSKGQIIEIEDDSEVEFILQNKIGEMV